VRSVENGREKTYTVRDVRISPDCSAQIQDADRLEDPADRRQWFSEEFNQQFSLRTVQASITPNGNFSRVLVTALSPGAIRLERSVVNQNRWNDPSLPGTGRRTEFPNSVQFDLPRDADTDRAFSSLRSAIDRCSALR
jgi:hypothetical protein